MSFDVQNICAAAKHRWLTPDEIGFLLRNWAALGLTESLCAPTNPANGELFLFDRKTVRNFKNDGIEWVKKKGEVSRVREDFVRFSTQDGEALTGFYTYSATNQTFRRRSYRQSKEGSSQFLVHYRMCSEDVRRRTDLTSSSSARTMEIQFGSTKDIDFGQEGNTYEDYFLDDNVFAALSGPWEDNEDSSEAVTATGAGVFGDIYSSLSAPSVSAVPLSSLLMAVDMAPSEGPCAGGSKVLICLSVSSVEAIVPAECLVYFGGAAVLGQRIANNVVRCFTPILPPGLFSVHLATVSGVQLTLKSEKLFFSSFEAPGSSMITTELLLPDISYLQSLHQHTPNVHSQYPITGGSPAQTLGKRTHNDIRQHKIRIVEKLESVKSVLISDETSMCAGTTDGDFTAIEWLDDSSLDKLATTDLERLTDRYVGAVMKGLLNAASIDPELQSSFNELDTLGFNLLHYCAMYKLNDLIQPLLEKGANIDQLTSLGSTALHLACSVGNTYAVQLFLAWGANASICDASGLSAEELAIVTGHDDIATLVHQHPTSLSRSTSKSSIVGGQMAAALQSSEVNTTRYLQEAFESLSVADKCALSISLGHHQQYLQELHRSQADGNNMNLESTEISCKTDLDSSIDAFETSDDFEMQSVFSEISESDKKSVDAFLKMMNPQDKKKLESEVKLIQNNVRGWLLRKNYINLREATKTLQVAWREKKKTRNAPLSEGESIGRIAGTIPLLKPTETIAITALQAATRGMIARKAFEKLHVQATMSSLLLQKSFSQRIGQPKSSDSSILAPL